MKKGKILFFLVFVIMMTWQNTAVSSTGNDSTRLDLADNSSVLSREEIPEIPEGYIDRIFLEEAISKMESGFIHEAIELLGSVKNFPTLVAAMLGKCYEAINDLETALENYEKAAKKPEDLSKEILLGTYESLGDIHLKKGRKKEALRYYIEAREFSNSLRERLRISDKIFEAKKEKR